MQKFSLRFGGNEGGLNGRGILKALVKVFSVLHNDKSES